MKIRSHHYSPSSPVVSFSLFPSFSPFVSVTGNNSLRLFLFLPLPGPVYSSRREGGGGLLFRKKEGGGGGAGGGGGEGENENIHSLSLNQE